MIKKTIFILCCLIILISCGRKGDPVYKDSKKIVIKNYLVC